MALHLVIEYIDEIEDSKKGRIQIFFDGGRRIHYLENK